MREREIQVKWGEMRESHAQCVRVGSHAYFRNLGLENFVCHIKSKKKKSISSQQFFGFFYQVFHFIRSLYIEFQSSHCSIYFSCCVDIYKLLYS